MGKIYNNILLNMAVSVETMTDFLESMQFNELVEIVDMIVSTYKRRGIIYICGNGGSHAQALHFAEELTGRFQKDRKPLACLALGEATHTTCVGNDYGFDNIFARQLKAFARPEDCLIALSTSGNSPNIREVLREARHGLGLPTAALLGRDGGIAKNMADTSVVVEGETSSFIQNVHMVLIHAIIECVERELFPENYSL